MAVPQPKWGEVYEMPASITADDLLRLPDDGSKNELYEGVLVREMTSPGHGEICHRLGLELGIYARATGFSQRIAQNALFDLTLPDEPRKTVLAPDVAILRGSAPASWAVPHEAPMLAIEVVSESQTTAELALKAQFYRNAGVDEVWVVDHTSRTIEVWKGQGHTSLDEAQTLTSALLPGFGVSIHSIFEE